MALPMHRLLRFLQFVHARAARDVVRSFLDDDDDDKSAMVGCASGVCLMGRFPFV